MISISAAASAVRFKTIKEKVDEETEGFATIQSTKGFEERQSDQSGQGAQSG